MGPLPSAAEKISRYAVGDPEATPGMTLYKVSRLANQMRHVPGTPFGTRGGTSVLHNFPADGEYSFHVTFYHYYPGELVGIALPEQLQGQSLEPRSDIFSFGTLLYEMLTGVHPFRKPTPMATAQAILSELPPPLTHHLAEVPELLQHTVGKMLAKEPGERYQSVHEVRTNLAQLPEYAAVVSELSGRLDEFFGQYANPRWDLWKGGVAKSNSTRPFLWKEVWGDDWKPEY